MTKADVVLLLEFNDWARGRMLDALTAAALTPEKFTAPLGNSFSSVRDTVVHIYSAEWVWHTRCQGHSPTSPLAAEDFPDLATIEAAWLDLAGKWRNFVEALGEDQHLQEIDYRLMNGQASRSAIWQIVQHVVNHSTYHRGQVMTLLRQLGAKAVSTDLIAFHRERRMNG
jgi:uncharacterized damage-inducible protein DinB